MQPQLTNAGLSMKQSINHTIKAFYAVEEKRIGYENTYMLNAHSIHAQFLQYLLWR
jgi:hypothetical protein